MSAFSGCLSCAYRIIRHKGTCTSDDVGHGAFLLILNTGVVAYFAFAMLMNVAGRFLGYMDITTMMSGRELQALTPRVANMLVVDKLSLHYWHHACTLLYRNARDRFQGVAMILSLIHI